MIEGQAWFRCKAKPKHTYPEKLKNVNIHCIHHHKEYDVTTEEFKQTFK